MSLPSPFPLSSSPVRILGIDPGLRVTGFGVLDKQGQLLTYVASGCIKTPDGELPQRLKVILSGLGEVIAQHLPQQVAVEKVFVNVNPQSTLLLGQARGAAICAAVTERAVILPPLMVVAPAFTSAAPPPTAM